MGSSRNEDILTSILSSTDYPEHPQSRIEKLLVQLGEQITADEEILAQLYVQSYYIDGAIGVLVDWETKTFTRLVPYPDAPVDADDFAMYAGRRPCCVADDGTITAWIDDSQLDDESVYDVEGQVMVYQPAFYYRVYPLKTEALSDGSYVLRRAVYSVSSAELPGFKLHPAFYDADGNAVDYILESVYDATIWDADGGDDGTGGMVKFNNSSFTVKTSVDKLCSVSAAGSATLENGSLGTIIPYWATTYQTAANFETLAQNRGDGWHADRIQTESAAQLLMLIEYCTADMQTAVGRGVVDVDSSSTRGLTLTDDTARLCGNSLRFIAGSGENTKETDVGYGGNVLLTYASRDKYVDPSILDGKVSVAWRYKTNPWGNVAKLLQGIYFVKPKNQSGFARASRTPTIYSLAGAKTAAGFAISARAGYISGFGYDATLDWLFIPVETVDDGAASIGDYAGVLWSARPNRAETYCAALGGSRSAGDMAGPFCLNFLLSTRTSSSYGSRLIYVPTADSETEAAAVASWKTQTGL